MNIDMVKGRVIYNEPMKRHTSFLIGGPAEIWVEPADPGDLKNCLMIAKEKGMPVLVVGGGTNLLVRDEGIKGMVIGMRSPRTAKICRDGQKVTAASSSSLTELLKFCVNNELGGLEFLAGVPGTAGGAVRMNAGSRHHTVSGAWNSIGDFVTSAKVMDREGNSLSLTKEDIRFSYRSSDLAKYIIVEIELLLTPADKKSVLSEYNNYLKKKKATQDLCSPSAGCVFKNPAAGEKSAGELIDRCGLKGRRVGGAAVSEKHANFIVNGGGATAEDVIQLMDIMRSEVRARFAIELESEIRLV